jgi:hypothetical protein
MLYSSKISVSREFVIIILSCKAKNKDKLNKREEKMIRIDYADGSREVYYPSEGRGETYVLCPLDIRTPRHPTFQESDLVLKANSKDDSETEQELPIRV